MARISGLIGPGALPYLPSAMSCAGWQIIFQRPNLMFIIACVPTIWDVGVTNGTQPNASRTTGISRTTSSNSSSRGVSRMSYARSAATRRLEIARAVQIARQLDAAIAADARIVQHLVGADIGLRRIAALDGLQELDAIAPATVSRIGE